MFHAPGFSSQTFRLAAVAAKKFSDRHNCAAAPALFYADKITPLAAQHPNLVAYLDRLKARPSFARVLEEAEPYFQFFPKEPAG